ncbi:MAG TPA: DcaP family trimeric outer membrane transporter [Prolixibacteraceae bacterium]|nr:DcaP family trimeric outer membrane transporter [Prolixibacteraceae bacterium]HPS13727.1 DcaP family trimeric outer membrane transporter [Prolixibacteraceae bacterium]
MKKAFIFSIIFLSFIVAKGESDDNTTLDFYGFVRVDAYMDTYKGVDAGHDIFYLLPVYNATNGVEVNKQLSSNITAMASRLGVRINFPDVLKAKATGLLEFDFAGNLKADPTLFRIRQAYSLMTWEKASLLIGHTWHPFAGNSTLPTVAGLNTGAPFTCFNRSPMIRYNKKMGDLTISASAVSQMQYNSPAIDVADFGIVTANQAKRNGVIPELVLTAEWNKKSMTIGAGAEYNRIKPRMMITGTEGSSVASEYLGSTAGMAYARYRKDKLTVLAKAFYGDNISFLTLPGGYGLATYDAATGKETYTSYTTFTSALNIVYGQKWQFGLFAGYGKNFGTRDPLYDAGTGKAKTYGSFLNMQTMYRVAPHISFNLTKFRVVAELERSSANYGTGTINFSDGLFSTTHTATNNRVIVTMTQFF